MFEQALLIPNSGEYRYFIPNSGEFHTMTNAGLELHTNCFYFNELPSHACSVIVFTSLRCSPPFNITAFFAVIVVNDGAVWRDGRRSVSSSSCLIFVIVVFVYSGLTYNSSVFSKIRDEFSRVCILRSNFRSSFGLAKIRTEDSHS